ncbi:NAD-glutamate dehydrogenase [Citricoccus muralis]|uniref:NAD-glutamate dehydrogenase n=1 Tax=Citricoccus muralis TaxID=169134 RepID=A0ABY8H4P7_9MICC|nr:NAD-glutamate dehydrogenase [Citricoccus muralis]WFP15628.1 NAD-glutamate dehydrogenase [Citricoccus muralis]
MTATVSLWSLEHASESTTSGPAIEKLTQAYFRHVSHNDQEELGQRGRLEAVEHHLKLAQRRVSEEPVVRVDRATTSAVLRVVQADMPFLVDSVAAEVTRQGYAIHMVAHPTFLTHHQKDTGELVGIFDIPAQGPVASGDTAALTGLGAYLSGDDVRVGVESWISIHTTGPMSEAAAAELEEGVTQALADVRASVRDWEEMRAAALSAAQTLRHDAPSQALQVNRSADLLEWMRNGNFTFIGYREYVLRTGDNHQVLHPVEGTGLGVLRGRPPASPSPLSVSGRNQIEKPTPLIITKTNSRSRVQRHAYMDYVAVKTYDERGRVVGERRFIGLWSASTYTVSIRDVPVLREKVDEVFDLAGFSRTSHSGSELTNLLETYPRDELFQMTAEQLWDVAREILQLEERRRTRLFLRRDIYGRFLTALVFLPRDRYNTGVRHRIEALLLDELGGVSVEYQVRLTESSLARLFFRVQLPSDWDRSGSLQSDLLEQKLVSTVRSWKEGVDEQALVVFGEDTGVAAAQLWDEAFPPAYRVRYEVEDALEDISRFTALPGDGTPAVYIAPPGDKAVRDADEDDERLRLKIYSDTPRTLTEILPVIQNLGLTVTDERPFVITPADGRTFHLYDLGVLTPDDIELGPVSNLVSESVAEAMTGRAASDAFNRLVLRQGLDVRTVSMLRGYGHYLRQLGVPHSPDFMADTLLRNPNVTAGLVRYFQVRFDPEHTEIVSRPEALVDDFEYGGEASELRHQVLDAVNEDILVALDAVPTLDADRVLRGYLTAMGATDRTNFYQHHEWLSLKIVPSRIPFAPAPRPAHEIWVESPDVSGTHLRFGAVARGGLRWSDRREDFRTEVLGLVQTQQVKNAVIVPTGAKGGFYAHRLPDPSVDRGAWMEAGKDAYRTFIRGLLDVTDNQVVDAEGTRTITREGIIRHDAPDAYLVVAADKGTASFSDTANAISEEYGHWLGDGFASGGSEGYDHKGMGITARGAWESVRSHFASFGHDVQTEDFTAVGIGDMSGDVFGNGMLRSRHTRLVAAFNHLHIFIDPNPDPEVSFQERERLYSLPRSSWSDYDPALISTGGGVFDRSAKSVGITPEIRELLDLDESVTTMTPTQLLKAVLSADVDLLYNGGIGTYIKATGESNDVVGDRANDAIRVNGADLRATVVVEGGNLGATQLGRIEAARNGVLINTDAIDNSAGVDTSDHEVNIKILLNAMIQDGSLDPDERAETLRSMTDNVAQLVLATNKAQNVLLRNDSARVSDWMPSFIRHASWLEANAGLDRSIESIPTTEELNQRVQQGEGLTTPELSVLQAYTKINLTEQLLESDLIDDPWFAKVLIQYFPRRVRSRVDAIQAHPLRRQIIATMVANDVVNVGGTTFVFRAQEETGAETTAIVKAYIASKEIYWLDRYMSQLQDLPVGIDPATRSLAYQELRRLLDRAVRWMILHRGIDETLEDQIGDLAVPVQRLAALLPGIFVGEVDERYTLWKENNLRAGFPEGIAAVRAMAFETYALLDIVTLARRQDLDPVRVAEVYFRLYDEFSADELLDFITFLPRRTRWQALARGAMRDDFYIWMIQVTESVLSHNEEGLSTEDLLGRWHTQNETRIERLRTFLDGVHDQLTPDEKTGKTDLAALTVMLRRLRSLVQ